ncbi:ABC transporter substrate-binding protein [Flavobacterium sp. UBA6135]|uniref:ABC transporter substrate-binding protein n=1 Tax=Flavobacterium sp. UBA6135 TaxID=1946553 RepID=UPI0025C3D868|nr:ABC transporter substrate-binding protein [Flavobacterium sp. UBA6135]
MKNYLLLSIVSFLFLSCQEKQKNSQENHSSQNYIRYATGLSIQKYADFSIVTVSNPWPTADKKFTYILHQKSATIPDSLQKYKAIQVPIQSIVVTSTTHIPALELLGVESKLMGFPNTDYISSEKTRALIETGRVREIGTNQSLNTEVLLDMQPDVIIGFGVDGEKKTYDNLQQNGLKILYNGDWTEQHPLGRSEWIQLFGVLFGLEEKADQVFKTIENDYLEGIALAKKATSKPTILSGAIYQDQWYLPQGKSWAAQFLDNANGNYLWAASEGTGSLSLSFETVLEKAHDADFWIGPGQFTSFEQLEKANPNYKHFKAVQNKNVYSFSSKKGRTGGVIYYELASNRPDLVLKDLIKILHPELMEDYELYFFEKLK